MNWDPFKVGIFPYYEGLVLRVSEILGYLSIWEQYGWVVSYVLRKMFPCIDIRGSQAKPCWTCRPLLPVQRSLVSLQWHPSSCYNGVVICATVALSLPFCVHATDGPMGTIGSFTWHVQEYWNFLNPYQYNCFSTFSIYWLILIIHKY